MKIIITVDDIQIPEELESGCYTLIDLGYNSFSEISRIMEVYHTPLTIRLFLWNEVMSDRLKLNPGYRLERI